MRFAEQGDEAGQIAGTIYVKKGALAKLGDNVKRIEVTIGPLED